MGSKRQIEMASVGFPPHVEIAFRSFRCFRPDDDGERVLAAQYYLCAKAADDVVLTREYDTLRYDTIWNLYLNMSQV